MDSSGYSNAILNDVWSRNDGANWTQEVASLPFEPRFVTVFNNQLIAATTKSIWASNDGINWSELTADTGYNHADNLAVHQNTLWVMNLTPDIKLELWASTDGVTWTKQVVESVFETRYSFGFISFNDALFVLGGKDCWVYALMTAGC